MVQTLVAFIRLGRLKFLGGGVLMYGMGVAAAMAMQHTPDLKLAALGLLMVLSSQLMTHYCNDYYDYEADCANCTPTEWSGGSRVLPSGIISLRTALLTAVLLGLVSALVAVYVYWHYGLPLPFLFLAAAMILLSWFYSAPPLRLHSTGYGEAAAALVVGVLWPVAGYYLQVRQLDMPLLLAVVPCFLLQFLMLIAIEFPDEAGDAMTGKRTFLVRLSAGRTAQVYMAGLALHFLSLPLLVYLGLPAEVALAMLVLLPLAVWQLLAMYRQYWQQPRHWNGLAFRSVFLFAATGLAEALAFLYLFYRNLH